MAKWIITLPCIAFSVKEREIIQKYGFMKTRSISMKVHDVDTIWEFEDLLVELADKNPAMFAPLSLQYQLVLQRHKTFIRIMVVFAWLVGFLLGFWIGGEF